MADLRQEPSMEDILASIKRIIAEDGAAPPPPAPRVRRGTPEPAADEVLELTDPVAPPVADPVPEARRTEPRPTEAAAPPAEPPAPTLVSDQATVASRQSLATLSAMVVAPEAGRDNTLDGLVRELLRPMLKEWLDAQLPTLVEGLVSREIARITGRSL